MEGCAVPVSYPRYGERFQSCSMGSRPVAANHVFPDKLHWVILEYFR